MNSLYIKLKESGNYFDAYLVIKNALSKELGNKELFREFIDVSLEIAMYDIVFDERKQYVTEADSALVLFAESTDMDEETLMLIKNTKEQINTVFSSIYNAEQVFYAAQEEQIRDNNNKLLGELADKNEQLQNADSQSAFDTLLADVAQIEAKLNKALFNNTQNNTYEILTKNYSHTISSKMEELNHKSLLEVNKQAVACFKDVFDTFRTNKGKYKDSESNLKALMTSKFFIFDTSKLFNESLVYYNHVYSMIFQEVNDNLKYKLTEWAIKTTKINK